MIDTPRIVGDLRPGEFGSMQPSTALPPRPRTWRPLALGVLLLGALALRTGAAAAQTRPEVRGLGGEAPRSVLYVGNSFFYYNNGIGGYVSNLLRGAVPADARPFRSTMATISGSGLQWHDVASYFRPGAVGSYSFSGNNEIVFNDRGRPFDVAIMMDCSQCPIHPQLAPVFTAEAKRDSEIVRRNGGRPAFFMSWAYADKPEMTEQLAEAYTRAGNENGALVIPAGLAFARATRERPDIDLYIWDKRHPSVAGTYLAASTIYAALFERSPEENTYDGGLAADTARFLRGVAWRTVRDYQGEGSAAQAAR